MDTVISLAGYDFGIIVTNTSHINSVMFVKKDLDKLIEVGKNKFITISGYPGDVIKFADFIQKIILLNSLKTDSHVSTHSVANCIRKEISDCTRNSPFRINLLLIGFDIYIGPSLYCIDYLGALQRMDFCVQGYASFFLFSFLDKTFQISINTETAMKIIIQSVIILKKRFIIEQAGFLIKIIDSRGCRNIGFL